MIKNQRILVTGASAGLGRALALQLGHNPNQFVLCARREPELLELKNALLKLNPENQVEISVGDISESSANQQAISLAKSAFNGLDIFIANAGQSMWSRFADIDDVSQIKKLMDLNFMGVVYGLHHALPQLKKSAGSFIAISSIQGAIPVPYHSAYVASKYAVNGFIETVRMEEPGVHFLEAMPGWIAGTELRSKALVAHKSSAIKVKTSHSKDIISADEVARLIMDAITLKKTTIYIPKGMKYLALARMVFPKTIDSIVKNKTDKQLK